MKNTKKIIIFSSILISLIFLYAFSDIVLPESFGKTHFIVDKDNKKIVNIPKAKAQKVSGLEDFLSTCKDCGKYALFAPDDNVLEVLTHLIENEKTSIRMAAFLLTDYEIIKQLLAAKGRGVDIEIVFDSKAVKSFYAKKVRLLKNKGIKVFVYKQLTHNAQGDKAEENMSNIMHNKFIIFGNNIFGKSLLWTGSFNFTYSAHAWNQENVVVFDDAAIIKKFINRFDLLKNKHCYVYGSRN
jgi:phosphatidylserine/phosphatidylglycerophosphate/cardiolipin synthase-like enzyme